MVDRVSWELGVDVYDSVDSSHVQHERASVLEYTPLRCVRDAHSEQSSVRLQFNRENMYPWQQFFE